MSAIATVSLYGLVLTLDSAVGFPTNGLTLSASANPGESKNEYHSNEYGAINIKIDHGGEASFVKEGNPVNQPARDELDMFCHWICLKMADLQIRMESGETCTWICHSDQSHLSHFARLLFFKRNHDRVISKETFDSFINKEGQIMMKRLKPPPHRPGSPRITVSKSILQTPAEIERIKKLLESLADGGPATPHPTLGDPPTRYCYFVCYGAFCTWLCDKPNKSMTPTQMVQKIQSRHMTIPAARLNDIIGEEEMLRFRSLDANVGSLESQVLVGPQKMLNKQEEDDMKFRIFDLIHETIHSKEDYTMEFGR